MISTKWLYRVIHLTILAISLRQRTAFHKYPCHCLIFESVMNSIVVTSTKMCLQNKLYKKFHLSVDKEEYTNMF